MQPELNQDRPSEPLGGKNGLPLTSDNNLTKGDLAAVSGDINASVVATLSSGSAVANDQSTAARVTVDLTDRNGPISAAGNERPTPVNLSGPVSGGTNVTNVTPVAPISSPPASVVRVQGAEKSEKSIVKIVYTPYILSAQNISIAERIMVLKNQKDVNPVEIAKQIEKQKADAMVVHMAPVVEALKNQIAEAGGIKNVTLDYASMRPLFYDYEQLRKIEGVAKHFGDALHREMRTSKAHKGHADFKDAADLVQEIAPYYDVFKNDAGKMLIWASSTLPKNLAELDKIADGDILTYLAYMKEIVLHHNLIMNNPQMAPYLRGEDLKGALPAIDLNYLEIAKRYLDSTDSAKSLKTQLDEKIAKFNPDALNLLEKVETIERLLIRINGDPVKYLQYRARLSSLNSAVTENPSFKFHYEPIGELPVNKSRLSGYGFKMVADLYKKKAIYTTLASLEANTMGFLKIYDKPEAVAKMAPKILRRKKSLSELVDDCNGKLQAWNDHVQVIRTNKDFLTNQYGFAKIKEATRLSDQIEVLKAQRKVVESAIGELQKNAHELNRSIDEVFTSKLSDEITPELAEKIDQLEDIQNKIGTGEQELKVQNEKITEDEEVLASVISQNRQLHEAVDKIKMAEGLCVDLAQSFFENFKDFKIVFDQVEKIFLARLAFGDVSKGVAFFSSVDTVIASGKPEGVSGLKDIARTYCDRYLVYEYNLGKMRTYISEMDVNKKV